MAKKNYNAWELQQKVNEVDNKAEKIYVDNEVKNINNKFNSSLEEKANKTDVNDKFNKVNSSLEEKASKTDIANISSGTPLFASSVAGMTDTTKNYVNTTDGYLYIYNSTSSTFEKSTVQYQAIGISENSVGYAKMNEDIKELFTPYDSKKTDDVTWIEGYKIDYHGAVTADVAYDYCKYPVKEGEIYKLGIKRMWDYVGWIVLDINDNVLLTDNIIESDVKVDEIIEIPHNGAYLCFHNWSNSFSYLIKQKYNLAKQTIEYSDLPNKLTDLFSMSYVDVTDGLTWISGYYVKSNGELVEQKGHSYSIIDVESGLECKITGKHQWYSSCYVIKDVSNKVIAKDNGVDGEETTFTDYEFTIPTGGVKLYINKCDNTKLLLKNKLGVNSTSKSHLDGETVLFSGDSICAALIDNGDGTYGKAYGWAEIIQENNPNAIIKNYGIGGTTVAKQENKTSSILERLEKMYSEYPNAGYIILEGGVNDCYAESIELGTVSDGYDTTLDEKTFCGALESLFKNAILKWKGKKIGYIVTFKVPSADYNNFKEYMDKAKEICEKWSIPYIDLYNKSGLQFHIDEIKQAYSYGNSGLHPNIEGYRIITPKIENWIKSL